MAHADTILMDRQEARRLFGIGYTAQVVARWGELLPSAYFDF